MGDVRWQSDQGDAMSTSTINSYRVLWLWWPSRIVTRSSLMLLLYSWMFQPEHKYICIRPPITSGETHLLWRSNTHINISPFFCKQEDKWDILPSRIYTTDNGDSLTVLSTGHRSCSSATTHCNNYIRILYIEDPSLISSMFQIDASSKVSSPRIYLHTSKTFWTG